jgi:glycosyltransferase involved in cell wall biosynthesis
VIVPCLNRVRFIRATLESILGQSYSNVECVVVDGGSTDGTAEALEPYLPRIRLISEPDHGPASAITKGWKQSSGEILAWLNADDIWLPGAAAAAVRGFAEHPDCGLVYGACGAIDMQGREIWLDPPRPWDLYQSLIGCDTIIHQPAAFVRRAAVERVGWLVEDWCHDHDLWLRLALGGARFATIEDHVANLRVWPGDAHNDMDIVVPALLRLVERTFAMPDLPEWCRGKQSLARSFAYLRCMDYLVVSNPEHWFKAVSLLVAAIRAKPANAPNCLLETARRVPKVGRRLLDYRRAFRSAPTAWRADAG